jgi:hypothetical protein
MRALLIELRDELEKLETQIEKNRQGVCSSG